MQNMTIHKLYIEDFDEIDYQLIAIHTTLEDYRLAYYINKNLPINLKKSNSNIQIRNNNSDIQFTRFIYEDKKKDISWNLIQNQSGFFLTTNTINQGLFRDFISDFSSKVYLLPEYKKVDFFLKIENTDNTCNVLNITNQLKKVNQINAVYAVETDKIKSKNNLIF